VIETDWLIDPRTVRNWHNDIVPDQDWGTKAVANLLRQAIYIGMGAEGVALRHGKYVIKIWLQPDDEMSTFNLWSNHAKWPQYVREAFVKLYWVGQYNCQCVTVTEFVDELACDTSRSEPLPHIAAALKWFCDTYGYKYECMIDYPNLGRRYGSEEVVLFDIL
jgi:hypothetical protein